MPALVIRDDQRKRGIHVRFREPHLECAFRCDQQASGHHIEAAVLEARRHLPGVDRDKLEPHAEVCCKQIGEIDIETHQPPFCILERPRQAVCHIANPQGTPRLDGGQPVARSVSRQRFDPIEIEQSCFHPVDREVHAYDLPVRAILLGYHVLEVQAQANQHRDRERERDGAVAQQRNWPEADGAAYRGGGKQRLHDRVDRREQGAKPSGDGIHGQEQLEEIGGDAHKIEQERQGGDDFAEQAEQPRGEEKRELV